MFLINEENKIIIGIKQDSKLSDSYSLNIYDLVNRPVLFGYYYIVYLLIL